jgi:hypothetical protein
LMKHRKSRKGWLIGPAVGLVALGLLNLVFPGGNTAEAQDDATPTAVATEEVIPAATGTSIPNLRLDVIPSISPEGDLDRDGQVDPGDSITYTISLVNDSDQVVPTVTVILRYDAAFIGATTPITPGAELDAGEVSWTVENVEPGTQVEFVVDAKLNRRFPSGRTQVQATAIARSGSIEVARQPAPPVEVQGPNVRIGDVTFELITDVAENGRIDPGDSIRFVISYLNQGAGPSPDVAVVADYPEELTENLLSLPENAQESDGELVWLVGSVPANAETQTVQFTVKLADTFPPGTTSYDLIVALRASTSVLDQRTVSVPVAGPNLVLSSRVEFTTDTDGDNLADPGDTLRITLQAANIGTESTDNITVQVTSDPALVEIIAVDQDSRDQTDEGVIAWTLPGLESGGTQELSFEVRVRAVTPGIANLILRSAIASDQVRGAEREIVLPADSPALTPTAGPTGTPSIQETRPAQGQGILGAYAIALLIGIFLMMSLLSIVYVASRVLPGTPEERENLDSVEERADHRRMVRELMEGIILTAILFSVMILGLQNALDQDSVNSIIAGIVGYVAGRVASSR